MKFPFFKRSQREKKTSPFFIFQDITIVKSLFGQFVAPYKVFFLLSIGCMLGGAACSAAYAWLMEPVINDIFIHKNGDVLGLVCGLILLSFILNGLFSYGQTVLMNYVGFRVIADLQTTLSYRLLHAPLTVLRKHEIGDLLTRCVHDVEILKTSLTNLVFNAGKDFFKLLGLSAVMIMEDGILSLLALMFFPIAYAPILRLGRRLRRVSTRSHEAAGQFLSHLTQLMQGIRLVKSYTQESYESTRLKALCEQIFATSFKAIRLKSLASPIMESLGGLSIVCIIAYGGFQVIEGARTPGEFFAFLTALLVAYEPFKSLSRLSGQLQEGLASVDRLLPLFNLPQEPIGGTLLPKGPGEIIVKNLSFRYPGDIRESDFQLGPLSFHIRPGELVAFVGPSGGGKSTLFNLLMGFFPFEGDILVDGRNLNSLSPTQVRSQMALVAQEVVLFDESIKENILYGCPTAPEVAMIRAAKAAAADPFIQLLPLGYDSQVGEQGLGLSGGQRQRIALARAFLKDAPILLLDEATSALDNTSEKHIQEALKTLRKGRTCLVVAHRLSTVQEADRIFVIEGGQIVEEGTHQSLLNKGGVYAYLYGTKGDRALL